MMLLCQFMIVLIRVQYKRLTVSSAIVMHLEWQKVSQSYITLQAGEVRNVCYLQKTKSIHCYSLHTCHNNYDVTFALICSCQVRANNNVYISASSDCVREITVGTMVIVVLITGLMVWDTYLRAFDQCRDCNPTSVGGFLRYSWLLTKRFRDTQSAYIARTLPSTQVMNPTNLPRAT